MARKYPKPQSNYLQQSTTTQTLLKTTHKHKLTVSNHAERPTSTNSQPSVTSIKSPTMNHYHPEISYKNPDPQSTTTHYYPSTIHSNPVPPIRISQRPRTSHQNYQTIHNDLLQPKKNL